MTCIVGIRTNNGVYIGGDSLGSDGHTGTEYPRPKVFRNGPFIMGYTSSFRMGQLLEVTFVPPKPQKEGTDDFFYLVSKVVPAIKKCLSKGGYETTINGQQDGGTFLLGYNGHLYEAQDDYSLLELSEGAVGSGDNFAVGSLYSTRGKSPKRRIKEAIGAAAHNCVSVGGKINIIKL